jgi:hypothetical protein
MMSFTGESGLAGIGKMAGISRGASARYITEQCPCR